MRLGRFMAMTCVARICPSSVVPQPKASAPRPPTVPVRVAVGHRVRRARQNNAEFRRDDVTDALLAVADIE